MVLLGTRSFAEERRFASRVARPYDEVVDDVKFAISGYNFRITGGNAIGDPISKRHGIVLPRSEVIHFCNLEYARKFVEIDPGYVLNMPCKVVVREVGDVVVVTVVTVEVLEDEYMGCDTSFSSVTVSDSCSCCKYPFPLTNTVVSTP